MISRLRHSLVYLASSDSILKSPRVRRLGLVLAAVMFGGGLWLSLRASPDLLRDVQPLWWLLILVCVPFAISLKAAQFWCSAIFLRVPVDFRRALTVTVLGTAANMLPLPGGSMLRVAALKTTQTRYREGIYVTFAVTGLWLAVASVCAGSALIIGGLARMGAIVLAAGIVTCATLASALYQKLSVGRGLLSLIAVQLAQVGMASVRLWLSFMALGQPVILLKAVVLAFAPVLASIVSVAPGGWGVREGLTAGIAAQLGIAPSAAFIAAALNWLSGLIVVCPFAVSLAWFERRRAKTMRHNQI